MRADVIVLGGAGMLGHKVFQVLRRSSHRVVATMRSGQAEPSVADIELLQGKDTAPGVDVMDYDRLEERLSEWRPEYVVNCVGIVKQRAEAKHHIASIAINALLPHRLAETVSEWGGHLIHFSTDCVFNGCRGRYREEDPPDAEDLYGRTKYLGEVSAANAVTLRTSIVGRELMGHRGLLDWFLSQRGKTVQGYRQVVYSGVTTNEMAAVVARMIKERQGLSGLYQVVSEPISKYELLSLFRDAYEVDVDLQPTDVVVSDRSMMGDRFRAATGYEAPSWRAMTEALAADATPYRAWGASVL